jgi:hypothetical protein
MRQVSRMSRFGARDSPVKKMISCAAVGWNGGWGGNPQRVKGQGVRLSVLTPPI